MLTTQISICSTNGIILCQYIRQQYYKNHQMDEIKQLRVAIQSLKNQSKLLEESNNKLKADLRMPPPQDIRVPQFNDILKQNTSIIYIREQILKELQKCCNERGMTVEMLFRCADKNFMDQLTIQELKDFLDVYFQNKLDPSILIQVATLFDDDCSGIITKEEFYRVCVYSKVNGEQHNEVLKTKILKINESEENPELIMKRLLQKFITAMKKVKDTPKGIVETIDYQNNGYITADELNVYLEKRGFGQNEVFLLLKYFDVAQTNKLKYEEFLYDLKEMLDETRQLEQLIALRQNRQGERTILELRKFREKLKQYQIDPLREFGNCQPDQDKKSIIDLVRHFTKKLKDIPQEQIEMWFNIIDTSKDQYIEMKEFQMALLIEDDLQLLGQHKTQIQELREVGIMEKLLDQMKKKKVSFEEFFDWCDTDKSQIVNVFELRRGLLALNLDLSMILKLMILFDKNQDGQIDICQFYDTFGDIQQVMFWHELEQNRIIFSVKRVSIQIHLRKSDCDKRGIFISDGSNLNQMQFNGW
ncbi:hypothetical protein pb186bvf_011816 [Paramecium bursaria]